MREATEAYEKFRLNEAAAAVYRFLWSDLADWYIEQIKPRLYGDVPGGDVARAVATQTFDVALRLLHPVMPFVTEALWRRFPGRPADASISVAPWPRPDARARDDDALAEFGLVQQVVGAIRGIRAEYGIQPGQTVRAFVSQDGRQPSPALERERGTIVRLAKLSELVLGESDERVGGHAVLPDGTSVFVPLGDAIDVGRECGRLGAEADRLGRARLPRRRRSSATSSSSPARRPTWSRASARSSRPGPSSARCWCGSGNCSDARSAGQGGTVCHDGEGAPCGRPPPSSRSSPLSPSFPAPASSRRPAARPTPHRPAPLDPPGLDRALPTSKVTSSSGSTRSSPRAGSPSQGAGTGDLEKLVILSPDEGAAMSRGAATRITVRPDGGWKPNRVYRVELLPGVTDLRRNRAARHRR